MAQSFNYATNSSNLVSYYLAYYNSSTGKIVYTTRNDITSPCKTTCNFSNTVSSTDPLTIEIIQASLTGFTGLTGINGYTGITAAALVNFEWFNTFFPNFKNLHGYTAYFHALQTLPGFTNIAGLTFPGFTGFASIGVTYTSFSDYLIANGVTGGITTLMGYTGITGFIDFLEYNNKFKNRILGSTAAIDFKGATYVVTYSLYQILETNGDTGTYSINLNNTSTKTTNPKKIDVGSTTDIYIVLPDVSPYLTLSGACKGSEIGSSNESANLFFTTKKLCVNNDQIQIYFQGNGLDSTTIIIIIVSIIVIIAIIIIVILIFHFKNKDKNKDKNKE